MLALRLTRRLCTCAGHDAHRVVYFFDMARDYFSEVETPAEEPAAHGEEARSIRNIPISVSRDRATPRSAVPPSRPTAQRRPASGSPRRGSRHVIWGVVAVAILALVGVGAVTVFRKSSIVVTPRIHTVVFDEAAAYQALPAADAQGTAALAYRIAEVALEERTTVTASGTERVEEYAKGTITVYNEFSDKPVRLIKNTRFETPDGKTFRVRTPIMVPAKTATAPGSMETTVYADQTGPEFNVGPVDRFALPGLKTGAPDMFEKVYAKSAAPMTGGYKGDRPIVADSDMNKATEALRSTLKTKALEAVTAAIPADSFAFPQLLSVAFEALPPQGEGAATQVGEKATVRMPYLSRADFARSIASATSADAGEGEITIPDTSTFTLTLASTSSTTITDAISFTLSGTAKFVWKVDPQSVATDLAGKDKSAFQTIVQSHPGVESAEAFLRPFWRSTFPTDPSKIIVTMSEAQ